MGADGQRVWRQPAGCERGAALVWAMLFVVITSGMVVAHAAHMASVRRELDAFFDRRALAETVVRSGATDALGWFRTRAQRPVLAFAPDLDLSGDPPVHETLDPALGLVREFEIRGNLWARYEIRHGGARDVSAERGLAAVGSAWELEVRGYVFRRNEAELDFAAAPNRIVAQAASTVELRSLGLALPALAAISVQDPAQVSVGANAKIHGGDGPGLAFGDGPTVRADDGSGEPIDLAPVSPVPYSTSPDPAIDPAATVDGSPGTLRLLSMAIDPELVFAARRDELARFADLVWLPGAEELPDDLEGALVLVPGDAVLSDATIDGALLVVDGDLTVRAGTSPTRIVGVLFVTGAMKVEGNFELRGALSVMGELELGDGTSPPLSVHLDRSVVDALRAEMRNYRLRRGAAGG